MPGSSFTGQPPEQSGHGFALFRQGSIIFGRLRVELEPGPAFSQGMQMRLQEFLLRFVQPSGFAQT
jgi:hypothetical protein